MAWGNSNRRIYLLKQSHHRPPPTSRAGAGRARRPGCTTDIATATTPIRTESTVQVNTKRFVRELEWANRFVERRSTIPILQNVKLSLSAGELRLEGTDLDLAGFTSVEYSGTTNAEDFALTVPAAQLLKYLKKVEESSLALTAVVEHSFPARPKDAKPGDPDPDPIVSKCELTVQHNADELTVTGMSAESFPELPKAPAAIAEISGLETAVPRVAVSISDEKSRFTLNGALLDQDRLISTDGHRLSVCPVRIDAPNKTKTKALIPKAALLEVARLGDSALFSQNDAHVFFSVGNRTVLARKLTGSFPDYERAMPKNPDGGFTANRETLLKAVERLLTVADEQSHCAKFMLTEKGLVISTGGEYSDGKAQAKPAVSDITLPMLSPVVEPDAYKPDLTPIATPYTAGFNLEYVRDFLKTAKAETVRFRCCHGATKAAQWEVDGWLYVLMPMRI